MSDLPRGRLDLLQRDPAGIKPPIGIDFKTKQKKNPFLLLVSCFKPNFCQNRHIASLVFLPHTHTLVSVLLYQGHFLSTYLRSIWQIPSDVCRIGRQQQQTFLKSTSLQISLFFGKISFLHQIQILISIRLIGIQRLINIHLVSFKILHQLQIPVPRPAPLRYQQRAKKGKNWQSGETGDIYIRKRSPSKCPNAQKTAERREKGSKFWLLVEIQRDTLPS